MLNYLVKYGQASALAMRQTSEGMAPKRWRFRMQQQSNRYRFFGKAICQQCGRRMRSDNKNPLCHDCREICACGKPKDYRAALCLSCGMRAKALLQWANPETKEAIYAAIVRAGFSRRKRYADLTEESFTEFKQSDGRCFARYSDDVKLNRTVYRYQWRWEQVNGPIPSGCHIHHVNGDCTDDRLENLVMLTATEHKSLHMYARYAAGK